jgi:hypothetical protein
MSTVKISELVNLPSISANTSNTIFLGVDLPTNITGRFTATTLAQQLFANNYLVVGQNYQTIFPNTVGQLSGTDPTFLQLNLQNFSNSGSGDVVVTADNGTNANNYIDMGINGSQFADSDFSSMKALDSYLYSHGPEHESTQGNLVIGTASTGANIVFIVGGTESSNIAAWMTKTGLVLNSSSKISFPDGTTMNTAAIGANYSQAGFQLANTNAADIVLIKATNAIQNANISTVVTKTQAAFDLANTNSNTITYITGVNTAQNTYASAAFAKANAALANATGTFDGDLTITGNTYAQKVNTANLQVIGTANISGTLGVTGVVSMNAQLVLVNTTFSATQSAVTISANPFVATPSNDGYMLHISGKQNVSSRIVADSYGANTYVVFAGRSARGTYAAPSALANGDIMLRISGNGYGSSQFAQFGSARIDFVASENWTNSARGSQIKFYNCLQGSNVVNEIASFNANSVTFTGAIETQKGFIFTPRLPEGAQTAISINYSTDSIIKANCAADVTISHTNFTYGKVVEVWLVNTSAQNKTVTHGVSAINSTTKSTTFTITAQSCAHMRFFSIDGDLANVFVTVTA